MFRKLIKLPVIILARMVSTASEVKSRKKGKGYCQIYSICDALVPSGIILGYLVIGNNDLKIGSKKLAYSLLVFCAG